jgi:hypothetical protein
LAAVLLLAGFAVVAPAEPAVADGCVPVEVSTWGGTWRVEVQCSDDNMGQGSGNQGGSSGGGSGGGPAYCTNARGFTLPCYGPFATWFDSYRRCHVNVASSTPTDPEWAWAWRGRTFGVVMRCFIFDDRGVVLSDGVFWARSTSDQPPAATIEEAMEGLLEGTAASPGLGVFPGGLANPDIPKAMGVVGVPAWFWADNPSGAVAAPVVQVADVNGWTLRVKVSLDRIEYDTGDGEVVTCRGLGVNPTGWVHEPTPPYNGCGHTYMHKGDYWITATTYAKLEWSLGGQRGQQIFIVPPQRQGRYHVGEIQVLIVNR